ncbi:Protein with similarity to mammalian ELMO, variant 3 [Dermatophagoides farinae]|nr:Protein with similarity to mammalian ELMO, variant 3 [Dermatophagoides farinae]
MGFHHHHHHHHHQNNSNSQHNHNHRSSNHRIMTNSLISTNNSNNHNNTVVAANNNNIGSTTTNNCQLLMPMGSNCAACHKPIRERFLLKALDQLWHEDCLKCSCCDCRLGEVGSTLFTKANLILCKRDYLRLFGATGMCSACNKIIPAFEMVMRVHGDRVYHLECFQCSQCNHRFCIGDRFHLYDNRILCEYDFEEMLVFGGGNNGNATATSNSNKISINNNHIDKLVKQTESTLASFSSSSSSTAGSVVSTSGPVAIAGTSTTQSNQTAQVAAQQAINPSSNHADDGSSGYGSPDSLLSDGR